MRVNIVRFQVKATTFNLYLGMSRVRTWFVWWSRLNLLFQMMFLRWPSSESVEQPPQSQFANLWGHDYPCMSKIYVYCLRQCVAATWSFGYGATRFPRLSEEWWPLQCISKNMAFATKLLWLRITTLHTWGTWLWANRQITYLFFCFSFLSLKSRHFILPTSQHCYKDWVN